MENKTEIVVGDFAGTIWNLDFIPYDESIYSDFYCKLVEYWEVRPDL